MYLVLAEGDRRADEEDQTDEEQRKEEGITEETMRLKHNIQKLNGSYIQKIGETLL